MTNDSQSRWIPFPYLGLLPIFIEVLKKVLLKPYNHYCKKSSGKGSPQQANIGQQDVLKTSLWTSPWDPIWPSRERLDLTSWVRPGMTCREHPNLMLEDIPGRLIRDVPTSFSGRPLEDLQSTSQGRCCVISILFQIFFLLFFRNLFDWPNLSKSNSVFKAYLELSRTFKMGLSLQS